MRNGTRIASILVLLSLLLSLPAALGTRAAVGEELPAYRPLPTPRPPVAGSPLPSPIGEGRGVGGRGEVLAAGRGNPWVNLLDGTAVPTAYVGPEALLQALETAQPRALAVDDFDEDGMPDLVAGYALPGGSGLVALHRGSIDYLWPDGPEADARRAAGLFVDAPFLPDTHLFALPAAPDFLGAGDFDNDGHRDVVAAARGGSALYLLPGDGRGGFGPAEAVPLPGAVTAFAAGEVNRRDGLQDLAVAVDGPAGPQLVVFEGPIGALRWEPEAIALPAPATSLAIGQMDEHYCMDIAAACGSELVLVHGRDRQLSVSAPARSAVAPAAIDRYPLPYVIAALALGDFVPEEGYRKKLALLSADGTVHFLAPSTAGEIAQLPLLEPATWNLQLATCNVSSLPGDDLAVLDPEGRQIHILLADPTSNLQPLTSNVVTLDTAGAPAALVPMRLNKDAFSDLVLLSEGAAGPVVAATAPMSVYVVNDAGDDPDGDPQDGICDTGSPGHYTGHCTLQAAAQTSNYNVGADEVRFNLPSGTPIWRGPGHSVIFLDPITIDNSGSPRVQIRHGLDLRSDSSAVRGLLLNGDSGGAGWLDMEGDGDIVEGTWLGVTMDGTALLAGGGSVVLVGSNCVVGGTVPQARNLLVRPGDYTGVLSITGGENRVQGNFFNTDVHGATALGTSDVFVSDAQEGVPGNNTIGGTTAAARNVFVGDVALSSPSTGALVQGNYVGIDADGTALLYGSAIWLSGTANTTGGTAVGAINVIAGGIFAFEGVQFIQGNLVGVDVRGQGRPGWCGVGVSIGWGEPITSTVVGGTVEGAGNTVAYCARDGVIVRPVATGVAILGNSIYANGTNDYADVGIDLCVYGDSYQDYCYRTANDPGDYDKGGNKVQNWPEIRSMTLVDGQVQAVFKVDSDPVSSTYPLRIEFFLADSPHTYDQGQTYLGSLEYLAGEARAVVTKTFAPTYIPSKGAPIVATATDAAGNTSEFSFPPTLFALVSITVNSTGDLADNNPADTACWTGQNLPDDRPECTLRAAIQTANVDGDLDAIIFDLPGSDVPTIHPGSLYNTILSPVFIDGTTAEAGRVEIDGTSAGGDGLYITAGGSTVRRLVINRFTGHGIVLTGSGGTKVQGCYIGTDAAGAADLGNGGDGVYINACGDNVVGGTLPGDRNVISGNTQYGVEIRGSGATGNKVQGNYIGTDAGGTLDMGNTQSGVYLYSDGNFIGGTAIGAGNVIAGNDVHGVQIESSLATGNRVQGNRIGVGADGATDLGNAQHGVFLGDGASGNTVGGTEAGAGNEIRFNGGDGVAVTYLDSTGNAILGNAIYGNTGLGIDLDDDGVTPNDAGDGDDGPNGRQNYPVLTAVTTGLGATLYTTTWVLNSKPQDYTIEYYDSAGDPTGYGEGRRFLERETVTVGGGTVTLTRVTTHPPNYVATATDPAGNTSEFGNSPCLSIAYFEVLHPRFPNPDNWVPVPEAGTVAGNVVAVRANVQNQCDVDITAEVRLLDDETGQDLPGEFEDGQPFFRTFPAGTTTGLDFRWDTTGFSWDDEEFPHPDRRFHLEVVSQQGPYQVKAQTTPVDIVVRPRPVVLVHGLWSDAPTAWSAFPGYLLGVRSDWLGYAVGDGQYRGLMDTGNMLTPWLRTNTIRENAIQMALYVSDLRQDHNAWHVDIVAHSMGGLISRYYIATRMTGTPQDGNGPVVTHLVMLGTPNLGSPCADLFAPQGKWLPAMAELTSSYVMRIFNALVRNQNGVPFYIYAGDILPFTCDQLGAGDSVVPLDSAFANAPPPVPVFQQMRRSAIMHTDMTVDLLLFVDFVLPILGVGPTRAHEAGQALPLGGTDRQPQLFFDALVEVPAGLTATVALTVPEGLTMTVVIVAPEAFTATLHSPVLTDVWPLTGTLFYARLVTEPVTGTWTLSLENGGTATATVPVVGVIAGSPALLALALGEPTSDGLVLVTATVTDHLRPVLGLSVTAEIAGLLEEMTATLTLWDDGAQGDGAADDGVYANTAGPLLPGDYLVTVEASGPGFWRATSDVLVIRRAIYLPLLRRGGV